MTALRLVRLSDCPEALPSLATLMEQVWPDHYGTGKVGCALGDLQQRAESNLPFGIAAMEAGGTAVGGVGVESTSYGANNEEAPWLVGLLVAPAYRRQGIAGLLIEAVETEASRLGIGRLYATVSRAAGLMVRQGWTGLRQVEDQSEGWTVMTKEISRS